MVPESSAAGLSLQVALCAHPKPGPLSNLPQNCVPTTVHRNNLPQCPSGTSSPSSHISILNVTLPASFPVPDPQHPRYRPPLPTPSVNSLVLSACPRTSSTSWGLPRTSAPHPCCAHCRASSLKLKVGRVTSCSQTVVAPPHAALISAVLPSVWSWDP